MNEIFKWVLSYFRSPDRVAPIELYEKSLAMNRLTLDELEQARKERKEMWDEQDAMHTEIVELRRQEEACQTNQRQLKVDYESEIQSLKDRIGVLEAALPH